MQNPCETHRNVKADFCPVCLINERDFLLSKLTDLNQLCIEAAITMNNLAISRHVQFVNYDDVCAGETARTGFYPEKLMKVTIEWVDENEANPENFAAPNTASTGQRHTAPVENNPE